MQVTDKMVEAARDWLRKHWCQEHPSEGPVKMLAEYAAALAHREAEAGQSCEGRDDPEERCPHHPSECTCWEVDLDHPSIRSALVAPPAQEPVACDEAETIERNPKSWIAWKREAERLAKLDPIDLAKEKIDVLARRADAGELALATLITNLKTGNVSPEKAIEWWESEGRAMLTAAQEGR